MGDFKEIKKQEPSYTPNEDEQQKLSFIKKRFFKLEEAKTIISKDYEKWQRMVDAKHQASSNSKVTDIIPIANALIENYVATAIKIKTEFSFKGEIEKYKTNARALEYAWKYDWRKNKRDIEINKNEYITATFGTSVIYTGFEKEIINQHDYDIKTGKFIPKEIENSKIILKNIDTRYFFPDDTIQEDYNEANDTIFIQYISIDTFKGFGNNKIYKNIDKITEARNVRDLREYNISQSENNNAYFVKLTHYWNLEKDRYIIVADDRVIIRDHPIITTANGLKALPFVMRKFANGIGPWGKGICERLMVYNSEINTLRQLLLQAIERSNIEVLAIGGGLSFSDNGFSHNNKIIEFDGPLGGNFQQITGSPPNQAIFNYLEYLIRETGVGIGIDLQNTYGDTQLTASQSEMMREASQKRMNLWLLNRDFAFERLADLYKDLLQKWFPVIQKEAITIEGGSFNKGKFKKIPGNTEYLIKEEDLKGYINIDAYTNATASTMKVVDREQKMDFIMKVGNAINSYAISKQFGFDLEGVIPVKELVTDLADDYNIMTKENDDALLREKANKIKKQFEEMINKTQGGNNTIEQPQEQSQMPTGIQQQGQPPSLPVTK